MYLLLNIFEFEMIRKITCKIYHDYLPFSTCTFHLFRESMLDMEMYLQSLLYLC